MTKLQGWIAIALLAFMCGYPIYQDIASRPSEATQALNEHYRQKCVILQDCDDWNRVNR